MPGWLQAFLLTPAAGIALTLAVLPVRWRWSADLLLRLVLGTGLGVGVCAWLALLLRMTADVPTAPFELALSVALAAIAWKRQQAEEPIAPASPRRVVNVLLAGVYVTILLAAAGVFCYIVRLQPYGEWDAWAMWNLRARLWATSGNEWRNIFLPQISHVDYPLLVPVAIGRLWQLTGALSAWAPITVAFTLTFAAHGLMVLLVRTARGAAMGWLAGIVLLGSVGFTRWGAAEYADIPLAFFVLAAAGLLLHERLPWSGRTLLAGVAAGLAAFTKNEGLLLAMALLAGQTAITWWRQGAAAALQGALRFAAGAAPFVGLVLWVRVAQHLPASMVGDLTGDLMARALDFGRQGRMLAAAAERIWKFGNWFIPAVLVLPGVWWCLGRRTNFRREVLMLTGIVAALHLAATFMIYVLAPQDGVWYVNTSFERIMNQLWPLAVLAFVEIVRSPEEAEEALPGVAKTKGAAK